MTINERFKKILDTLNISVEDCAKRFGKTEGYIRKLSRSGESFGIEPIMMILNSIDGVDANWLLKEEGEMMKNNYTNNVNVADNASVRNVIGNINGHSINVDAPKAESVKIIKPDGTVETYTSNHSLQELSGSPIGEINISPIFINNQHVTNIFLFQHLIYLC